ncbi:TlpA family protein disulfide reductase [Hymenobacter sp. BT18]|uniref:TlpA family protein disulfide reductase n=1 Tax=Hymenobacter sp. BT18 TaxID=2835648 RepID=UPI00143E1953|nr:TlpA disulfide reductase family protein [Hymenobacter sp. BT18]QIX59843.1 TlpA family protein disulfide reductase [Hymenobacter sp. BT18]
MPFRTPVLVVCGLLLASTISCHRAAPTNRETLDSASAVITPDLQLPTPEGSSLKLSSLRGQYVLVDFWASWCGPCRQESPNLRKIYGQFHSRGLEIVSVSLDVNRDKWLRAVAADQLSWPQVSDLKGWESSGARAYGVTALPFNLLLGPEGQILATDLHGRALGQKISEYIPLD